MLFAKGTQKPCLKKPRDNGMVQFFSCCSQFANDLGLATLANHPDWIAPCWHRLESNCFCHQLAEVEDQFTRQDPERVLFLVHRPHDANGLDDGVGVLKSGGGTSIYQGFPIRCVAMGEHNAHPGARLEDFVHLLKRLGEQVLIIIARLVKFAALNNLLARSLSVMPNPSQAAHIVERSR